MVTIKRLIRESDLEMYLVCENNVVIAFLVLEALTLEKNEEEINAIFKSVDDLSYFKDYVKVDAIFREDYEKNKYTELIFSMVENLIPVSAFEVTYYLTTHVHNIEDIPLILNQEDVRNILTLINSKYDTSMLQLNRF